MARVAKDKFDIIYKNEVNVKAKGVFIIKDDKIFMNIDGEVVDMADALRFINNQEVKLTIVSDINGLECKK
jgi:hypothetical protein